MQLYAQSSGAQALAADRAAEPRGGPKDDLGRVAQVLAHHVAVVVAHCQARKALPYKESA